MEKNLTEAQVTTILKNAPKGTDPNKIVEGLVSRGYTLQGLNDAPAEAPQTNVNNATFQATGDEGVIGGTIKALGNVPSSSYNLGKNVVDAVSHPIDTAINIGKIVKGVGAKVAQLGVEAVTDSNSDIYKRAVVGNEDTQRFDNIISFFKDRYGSVDNLKKTAIEDPAGMAADISALFTGGGALATKVGTVSKLSALNEVGSTLSKVGQATEPINLLSKAKSAVGNSVVGNVISDISPTSYKMQQGQVVKALELTPGDLSRIQTSTGNDVTRFIVDKNLIKNTPEETAHALGELRQLTKGEVRSEVGRVSSVYNSVDVPYVKDGLNVILKDVKGVAGQEKVAQEIESLANKEKYTLSDIQRAKELLDENSNVYSKLGSVKENSQAKGLANLRENMKTFIEDEVTKNTNGQTNIKQLNNDVQTSYSIEEAINNRAMKGMSRQYLSAFDLIVGTSGTMAFGPVIGAGIVIGKKIAESPALRLKFAKILSKQPISFIKKFSAEMAKNNLSETTRKTLQSIIDEAKNSLPYIESGSNVLGETEESK